MGKLFAAAMLAATMLCNVTGCNMNDYTMERLNASFRRDFAGNITAEVPEAVLLRSRTEFSKYLSDPRRFFDGRFAFYEQYEGEDGAFFTEHDLIAIIVNGEKELDSCKQEGELWLVSLLAKEGEENACLYFITMPKIEGMAGVSLTIL